MSTIKRADRKLWEVARTLTDLGECMALWLEGEVKSRAGYYGPTDLDSPELTALCAGLCRAGYVTHNSQLAHRWEHPAMDTVRTRTWIEGFASDDALARLQAACDGTGIILAAHRTPRARRFRRYRPAEVIPDQMHGDRISGSLRLPTPLSYVDVMWKGVSDEAWRVVLEAWQVIVVGPEWGHDRLVGTLTSRFLAGAR